MKHRKEKDLKIGDAVFRGNKTTYNFDIFPIGIEFQPASAIFIISRRKIDKLGKGHHKFICIGQTESLIEELAKHKKGNCVTQQKANVVCVLLEADKRLRLKIAADLKVTYAIPCLQN